MVNGLQPRRMLCYDRRPGGLGICETLAAAGSRTLKWPKRFYRVVMQQPPWKGCPSCLLDGRCSHYNENLSKGGAIYLLGMPMPPPRPLLLLLQLQLLLLLPLLPLLLLLLLLPLPQTTSRLE